MPGVEVFRYAICMHITILIAIPVGLLAAPLIAISQAESAAATAALSFILQYGFDADMNAIYKNISYAATTPSGEEVEMVITTPLISLLQVPFIKV